MKNLLISLALISFTMGCSTKEQNVTLPEPTNKTPVIHFEREGLLSEDQKRLLKGNLINPFLMCHGTDYASLNIEVPEKEDESYKVLAIGNGGGSEAFVFGKRGKEKEVAYSCPKDPYPETLAIYAFFGNEIFGDYSTTCSEVFPVTRSVAKDSDAVRATLEELLKGPTEKEKEQGYTTNLNPNITIQNLTVADGTASVDFSNELEYQVGGSCRIEGIYSQITKTLTTLPHINDIIISINGRTEDILQP